MKKRYILGITVIVGFCAALVVNCGKSGGQVVAKLGSEEITVAEFADFIKNKDYPYRGAQDEFNKKREFLDSMINLRLVIRAAYESGLDKSEEIARVVLANKNKFLLDALYQKLVVSKAPVSDAELKEMYERLANKIRASHILVNTFDSAEAIVKKLTAGENFEQLAYQCSTDPSAKRNRGDLGYFTWGSFPPQLGDFEQAAFKLEPGEISTPVKTQFGYHIIKLIDKQPNDLRAPYRDMEFSMRNQIGAAKRDKILSEYIKELKTKFPVTVDTTTCMYVVRKRADLYPPQLQASLPKNDFDDAQLDRNERELVIATWPGGQLTLYEYLQLSRAQNIPAAMKPEFTSYDSLANFVFQLKLSDILTYEANQLGLENDELFKKNIKLFKEYTMADVMRIDSIPKLPPPDESAMRLYFDEHKEEYTNAAQVRVYEILVSDEMVADRLAREIKSIEAFRKKAKELTERPAQRGQDGDLGYVERQWFPEIFDLAWKSPVGSVQGPVVTVGRYSVIYVIDKKQAEVKDFLAVKGDIMQKMQFTQKNDEYWRWVDDRRKSVGVTVNEEAIRGMIDQSKYPANDSASVGNG